MRFYSTPLSALNGEITTLAIIECIVSVLGYVAAELHLGTLRYLAFAVAAAPIAQLRTDAASRSALMAYNRFAGHIEFL